MKKILAMFVAFACTLGAFADVQANISGTDFSTYPVGVFTPGLNDSGENDGTSYWYTGFADDLDAEVVNLSTDEESGVAENYLAFESNVTNPLYRTVNDCYGSVEDGILKNSGMAITNAFFIDTTVQFTPYLVNENHPAPTKTSDEDKIIVWVRETENSEGVCETNLIVTAGYILGGALVEPKDYVIDMTPAAVSALCQGQHRLTIKAFENITEKDGVTIMGFVVYIDGTAVSYSSEVSAFSTEAVDQNYANLKTTPAVYYTVDAHKLFPSMVTPDQWAVDGYSSITAVGFAGMGQIGEVWFDDYTTDYPAFAGDNLNFTVVVGNGVKSFDYLGNTYRETTKFAVAAGTVSIDITNVQYDTDYGWTAKSNTWFVGKTVVENAGEPNGDRGTFYFDDGDVFELAGYKPNFAVVVGETVSYFETLTGKITEKDGALDAAIGGTLKLLGDITIDEAGFRGITINQGQSLEIDLNGFTLRGTSDADATIENFGTLVITDSSENQTGKVLCNGESSTGAPAINVYDMSSTTIWAGQFDMIYEAGDQEIPAEIELKGGKFFDYNMVTAEDPFYLASNIADGKAIIDVEERIEEEQPFYWVVVGDKAPEATHVAKIGETEYTSLEEAIAAATAESEIKIIANIDTDSAFVIQQQTVTIDLNGYTIRTTENDKSGDGVFWVKAGGTLTIKDTVGTGVINGVGGNNYNMAIWADGGTVIIKGGKFTNEGATDEKNTNHFDLIYVKNGGIVEITGGTFRCQTPRWTLNKHNTTEGSFDVTGGTFYQYDPTNIDTDEVGITSWCRAGYVVTEENGYYTVEEITDPWAPAADTDAAAQTKVAEIFEGYPAAIASITTYAAYTNLVAYVKGVKGDEFAHTSLSPKEKLYIVDSLKLGAGKLFKAEPEVKVTSVTPDTTTGNWTFEVTVKEDDDVVAVAVEKVKAFVKICSDLKNGQWAAPQAENIEANPVTGKITIKFGDVKSGFMKISE